MPGCPHELVERETAVLADALCPLCLQDELARVNAELAQVREEAQATLTQCAHLLNEARTGSARVIHALDCALIWGEALFGWLPEGMVLSDGVKTAKGALDQALKELRR